MPGCAARMSCGADSLETSLHDPIKLRRRPIEDILDAALEHGDVGVVEFVLDVLRVELDAAEIFLVEDGRGRARGRDRQFASIDVPAKPLRHGAGAKRAIRHPEAASIETGVEEGISWAFRSEERRVGKECMARW